MYQHSNLSVRQKEALRDLAERGPSAVAPQRTWECLQRRGAVARLDGGSRYITLAGWTMLVLIEEAEQVRETLRNAGRPQQ